MVERRDFDRPPYFVLMQRWCQEAPGNDGGGRRKQAASPPETLRTKLVQARGEGGRGVSGIEEVAPVDMAKEEEVAEMVRLIKEEPTKAMAKILAKVKGLPLSTWTVDALGSKTYLGLKRGISVRVTLDREGGVTFKILNIDVRKFEDLKKGRRNLKGVLSCYDPKCLEQLWFAVKFEERERIEGEGREMRRVKEVERDMQAYLVRPLARGKTTEIESSVAESLATPEFLAELVTGIRKREEAVEEQN